MDSNQPIITQSDLRHAISQLETKRDEEATLLKAQFKVAYESVKPINLIKSTFREVTSSSELKDNVLGTTVGLAAGMLSKVLFVGLYANPLRRLAGSILMFGVTNLVTRNGANTGGMVRKFLSGITRRRNTAGKHLSSGDSV